MSGIVAVLHRDGHPASALTLRSMAGAAPYRGPDGTRYHLEGNAGIAHQRSTLTPEDAIDAQPIVFVGRGLSITFDGRIDNRAELIAALDLAAGEFRSDAALVAAAYARWGEQCAARLLGDFAFVVLDSVRRAMFCARDPMGIKPLYYAVDARTFVCGSEIRQVLAALPARPDPNEGLIAEVLARSIQSQDETFYQGVCRLPAAHTLMVTTGAVRVNRYWSLDPGRELTYGSDQEYADAFRALFKDAVACRLRTSAPVGVYLSGGLDSSSVVGMAYSLGAQFETYSLVLPDDPFADESRYIDAVVQKWGLTGHVVRVRDWDPEHYRERLAARGDMVDLPADAAGEALYPAMRQNGVRVALTGAGGDYGFAGSLYHYADLLHDRNLSGLVRQVWSDAQISDVGWSASQLFWSGVRPLLPRGLKRAARPLARGLGWIPGLPAWIGDRFAARVDLPGRLAAARTPEVGAHSRRHVCTMFASGWPYWLLESAERRAAEHGVEERHPFFDRRVIEFSVAIPERQRWQGQYTKFVVRNALRDLLPDLVAARTDKGDYGLCLANAVAAVDRNGLFEQLQIASLGWVNTREVAAMRRRALDLQRRGDEAFSEPTFNLWMIAAVELWYRQTYGEGVDHEPGNRRNARHEPARDTASPLYEAGAR